MTGFESNGPAAPGAWDTLPRSIASLLPDDYREFILIHNGGEGFVGEHYITLATIEGLADWNEIAQVAEWIPGGVLIGSNGGGEYYGFFPVEGRRVFGQVPGIGMEPDDIWEIPMSFGEFMRQRASA